MTSSAAILLHGLHPQPMASYLATLGVLRICGQQHDSEVRGAFSPSGFRLEGIDETALLKLLLDDWQPTPILSPWNNASGFYDSKTKGQLAAAAMAKIGTSTLPRLAPLNRSIEVLRKLVAQAGYDEAPKKGQGKEAFIASLRGVLSDDAVAWIDSVAVVDDDDATMMPVLGSGGNEGVLEYAGLFMRLLVDTVLGDRERSERLLRSALFGTVVTDLVESAGGQFDPGTAGGFNTGPGFMSKDLPNNPWRFLLLIEGSLVWTSALASRQQGMETNYRFAVSPFTVRHRAAGYGSAGHQDGDPQRVRAEVWLPVWRRPACLREVARFIAEGRVEVRARTGARRRAKNSLDFAEAVASLGVDRGVGAFVRYALIKRRGDSYLALPAGVIEVHYRREADLLRQLDPEMDAVDRFFARFPSEQGPPTSLVSRRRAIDDARWDVTIHGGAEAMIRLVRAIGALEMVLARRDPGKEPRLRSPLGRLGPEWVDACGDRAEVRVAAAIASITATGGAGPIRMYLAPLDRDQPGTYAPAMRTVPYAGVDLSDRLGAVLHRRLYDARTRSGDRAARERGNPTWGRRLARLDDVANYFDPGALDERMIEELIFGFTWVRHAQGGMAHARGSASTAPPLPRSYSLLKLVCLPHPITMGDDHIHVVADPNLVPLLRAGRVSDAIGVARHRLLANGILPRRVADLAVVDAALGRRLAAALLIPVAGTRALLQAVQRPDSTLNEDNKEETDGR